MDKPKIPTEEEANKLMNEVLKRRNVTLNEVQKAKFKHACIKSYSENPKGNDEDLIVAANIYLNYILDFPDLTL